MITFSQVKALGGIFDASGIDNPNEWLWDNHMGLGSVPECYFAVREITPQPQMDAKFIQSLQNLKKAMCEVWENWPYDDGNIPVLIDNYPFDQSFDELTIDVAKWIDKINSSLTNQTT